MFFNTIGMLGIRNLLKAAWCIPVIQEVIAVTRKGNWRVFLTPVSNLFVPDLRPAWQECSRVLKSGGKLLSGFMNPNYFLFDHYAAEEAEELKVCYKLPASEPVELDEVRNKILKSNGYAIEFVHSLEVKIGGQI